MKGNNMNPGSVVNQQAAQRRAESYYLLYASMGSDRSLSKLQETLSDLGLKVALGTLKNYSATYRWQDKSEGLDRRSTDIERLGAMDSSSGRQARLGRVMQELAKERMDGFIERGGYLSPGDIVRFMKVGVDIERLAMGVPMERVELITSILSPVVYDIVDAFAAVNKMDDPQQRINEFARRADAIIDYHLPEDYKRAHKN
jgi:hypothetical protein